MSESPRNRSERYELAQKRGMVISLAYTVSIGGFFLAGAFGLLGEGRGRLGLMIGGGYFVALLVMRFVTVGKLSWPRRDRGARAHCRDEWTLMNRNRAVWTAFWVMLAAQVPLMFAMANVPPINGLVGMAGTTMALGLATFFGAFLYFSRLPSDG